MTLAIPLLRLQFKIQKGVRTDSVIIPIGSDCHPGIFLKALKAKKNKLPFDCMNIQPLRGLEFARMNCLDEFKDLTSELKATGHRRFKSSNYEYAEFFHERDSLLERRGKLKLKARIKQLLYLKTHKVCSFLYCLPGSCITSTNDLRLFQQTVYSFISIIKPVDKLHIYIRWNELQDENDLYYLAFKQEFNNNGQVIISKFILNKKRFGIWGDQSEFRALFKDLKLGAIRGLSFKFSRTRVRRDTERHSTIEKIKNVLVQIEDRQFYQHQGINIKGILRAAIMNLRAGKIVQGGSSLTQQLARNLLNDNSITFKRKFKELYKAIQLEILYGKEKILDLYVENIYFGFGIRGFRSASNFYFKKELETLNQTEYILLITILRSPMYYTSNVNKLKERFVLINRILMQRKSISQSDYDISKKIEIIFSRDITVGFINYYQSSHKKYLRNAQYSIT